MTALIFDMDGVIVDSDLIHRQTWIEFNRRYGLETTEEMLRWAYGKRNDQIVSHYFGDGIGAREVDARGLAKEQLYREMAAGRVEEMLVPGLRAFLERHRDLPMAVGSNAEPRNVAFVLQEAALRRYFRVVVDGHQVPQPKPHPDIYLRAAELLQTEPADCIVFEDSHAGVAAARAAGMRVIGLGTTYGNLPGAVLTIDNFLSGDLEPWLQAQTPSV
ncbi:MAG: HAD family phosphatase [Candidatus Solibacter sp.]|jgi:beta-phosphoglucomutase family hydrolase